MKTKNLLLPVSLLLALTIFIPTFSFAQGAWTQKIDFPGVARWGAVCFSIGTKGYIGLGDITFEMHSGFKDFWEWDQLTNVWTKKADYPGNTGGVAVGFSIGTKGYIGTGSKYGSAGFTNDFWEYNSLTNIWTQKATLPGAIARSSAAGFSIGTKGYIGTGCLDLGGENYCQDFWEWDQNTDVWTQKADFGGGVRAYAVGFSIGTKGYIGMGNSSGYFSEKDFWEWDQSTNVWTKKADFGGTARRHANYFSIGTKGYIGMGVNTSLMFNDFWEWDQNTNIWAQKASLPGTIKRIIGAGFSIGTKGYIGTGGDFTTFYKDFWEYDPSIITGIEEATKENIFVYPNPTSGKFTIKNIELQMTNYKLEIYNVLGRKIYSNSKFNQPTSNEIDLSNSPKGIYFVNIYDGEKFYTEKIVIQ